MVWFGVGQTKELLLLQVTSPFTYASKIKWSAPGVDPLLANENIIISGWGIHKVSTDKLINDIFYSFLFL